MSTVALQDLRERFLPMIEIAAARYAERVPHGYPVVIDAPERGTIGIEIDPSYALYITSDGDGLFAEIYRRSPRTDSRSSAGRQKSAGAPTSERRPIATTIDDQALRNLIAELMAAFNQQPGLIRITDD